jgi:trimeric autotransporter adhesin
MSYVLAGTANSAGFDSGVVSATSSYLNNPRATAVDRLGNIYVADTNNHAIRRISLKTGLSYRIAGTSNAGYSGDGAAATNLYLYYPWGVAVDSTGSVYIADTYNYVIRRVDTTTGTMKIIAGQAYNRGYNGEGTNAYLNYPYGVAVDTSGNVFIADSYNHRIRKATYATGSSGYYVSTFAGNGNAGFGIGGDGGAATSSSLYYPSGVAVDLSGNVYIADTSNNRVRMISASTQIITTLAGNGVGRYSGSFVYYPKSASINSPYGISVDISGNVYFAEQGSYVIRKIEARNGTMVTLIGTGTAGFNGIEGPATAVSLSNPYGVTVDAAGNVYVADSSNQVVRIVSSKYIFISNRLLYYFCAHLGFVLISSIF